MNIKTNSENQLQARAAKELNISRATLKNWIKQGVVKSADPFEIQKLKRKIKNGKIDRLKKRANKTASYSRFPSAELLQHKENENILQHLVLSFLDKIELLAFAIYIKQLEKLKIISFTEIKNVKLANHIIEELAYWKIDLHSSKLKKIICELENENINWNDNLLGYIYQMSTTTGAKQKLGAFYTPESIIKYALNSVVSEAGTFHDPCCGAGNFLITAYKHLSNTKPAHEIITGSDIDSFAVKIARANLTIISKGLANSVNQIKHADSLLEAKSEDLAKQYQYIMTNPPWGAKLDFNLYHRLMRLTKMKDSFSFFLVDSLQKLKPNGILGFILPVSFMNVKAHASLRRYVFKNYQVNEIALLSEKFSGVLTETLFIKITNHRPNKNIKINIFGREHFKITLNELLQDADCVIALNNNYSSREAIKEIESLAPNSLLNNSQWVLGIVTGDNAKYLKKKFSRGCEPIIKGSDVFKFGIKDNLNFIIPETEKFQQCAPLEKFYAPKKLVYRFISNQLVFATDRKQRLTLNSANIVVPSHPNYSCELLSGIFNSSLGQFYFKKKFNSIKVLRSMLETFPLPEVDFKEFKKIESIVEQLEFESSKQLLKRLDELIFNLYGLSAKTRQTILNSLIEA